MEFAYYLYYSSDLCVSLCGFVAKIIAEAAILLTSWFFSSKILA
jgi:hypothetical protein